MMGHTDKDELPATDLWSNYLLGVVWFFVSLQIHIKGEDYAFAYALFAGVLAMLHFSIGLGFLFFRFMKWSEHGGE